MYVFTYVALIGRSKYIHVVDMSVEFGVLWITVILVIKPQLRKLEMTMCQLHMLNIFLGITEFDADNFRRLLYVVCFSTHFSIFIVMVTVPLKYFMVIFTNL